MASTSSIEANPPTEVTNAFNSQDSTYQGRLRCALGQQQQPIDEDHHTEATNVFKSKDEIYQKRLNQALRVQSNLVGAIDQGPSKHHLLATTEESQVLSLSRLGLDSLETSSTRLVFLPSDPGTFTVAPVGLPQVNTQAPASEWVELSHEGSETSFEPSKVLVFDQTINDVGCDVSIKPPGRNFAIAARIYFDPARDRVTIVNKSKPKLTVSKDGASSIILYDTSSAELDSGTWLIFASEKSFTFTTKLLVLPRRFFSSHAQSLTQDEGSSQAGLKKRPIMEASGVTVAKKTKGLFAITHALPSSEIGMEIAARSHPVGDLKVEQTVQLLGPNPRDNYSIKRINTLSDRRPASVWQAAVSTFKEPVVVKVLVCTDDPRRAANMWLQEIRIHLKVGSDKHRFIAQLLAWDARSHTIIIENVPAPSLRDKFWLGPDNFFSGTISDAEQVMTNMVDALVWMHGREVAHKDIKLDNILFSRARGAVLLDFGQSNDDLSKEDGLKRGGTPWYLPPEFLETYSRWLPGDIWALGVVMLYLLRKLDCPESYPVWWISNIVDEVGDAADKMSDWLNTVAGKRRSLGSELMDRLVRQMTEEDPRKRVVITGLEEALKSKRML